MIVIKNLTILMILILSFGCTSNIKEKNAIYNKYSAQDRWNNACIDLNNESLNEAYNKLLKGIDFKVIPKNDFDLLWENFCDCSFNTINLETENNNIYSEISYDNMVFENQSQANCFIDQVLYKILTYHTLHDYRNNIKYTNLSSEQLYGLVNCQFQAILYNNEQAYQDCECRPEIKIEYRDRYVEKKVHVQPKSQELTNKQRNDLEWGKILVPAVVNVGLSLLFGF